MSNAVAVALTALLITGFIFKEQKRQLESTQYRLKTIATRDAAIVHSLFDHDIDTLNGISVYLKSCEDLTSEETIGFLNKMADAFEFESLSLAYSQNDQIFITDVTRSTTDGIPIIYIQVPVNKDGLPVAQEDEASMQTTPNSQNTSITLTVGDTVITAELYDSEIARQFAAILSQTISIVITQPQLWPTAEFWRPRILWLWTKPALTLYTRLRTDRTWFSTLSPEMVCAYWNMLWKWDLVA